MPDIEYDDYVKFSFFKLDRSWRLLSASERKQSRDEFAAVVEELSSDGKTSTYSTVGTRADVDMMIVQSAESVEAFHQFGSRLNSTHMAAYLEQPYSFLSVRRKSRYKHGVFLTHKKDDYRYFVIYPMVKTRAWYGKSIEERQKMMNDHFRVGHKYPMVKINTTYSFGMDDPEFVVGFEMDNPSDFVSLVMDLREVDAAQYTLSETPIFTTIRMPISEVLQALG
ncbi:MAG: chlorite dismutase family protein [Chloroflexi bacterium]|nr:chlorite dismutase family protein [Chloroflexota bacterium]